MPKQKRAYEIRLGRIKTMICRWWPRWPTWSTCGYMSRQGSLKRLPFGRVGRIPQNTAFGYNWADPWLAVFNCRLAW